MAMTYTRVGDLRGSDKIVHCLLNSQPSHNLMVAS